MSGNNTDVDETPLVEAGNGNGPEMMKAILDSLKMLNTRIDGLESQRNVESIEQNEVRINGANVRQTQMGEYSTGLGLPSVDALGLGTGNITLA